jgi:DNA-binding transcriptional LysR family regulator
MTLEQLRVFVAVAERQHITRAATALNMAQSAVSSAVSALEERHGAKLFDRVGRGIVLTQAGTLFLSEARAVLGRAAAAETVLAEIAGLKRGTLTVHASQTIASYWLPRHLVEFHRVNPAINIRLRIGNTAEVARAVHEGESELGFVEGLVENDCLLRHQIARDQLIVVVAPEHPWAGIVPGIPALVGGPWVLRETGSGTRSAFERAMAGFGVSPAELNIVFELPSNEAVRAAVEAGLGATAVSASVAAPSLEAGLLSAVDLNLPDRGFHVLRHRKRYLSRACISLLELVGC